MKDKLTIYVCGYFSTEVTTIVNSLDNKNIDVVVFPSNCGRPPLKDEDLCITKDENKAQNCIFGSTCVHNIKNNTSDYRVIHFHTCFDMILNKNLVNHYISNGSHLITPGWLLNWKKEIEQWGFNKSSAIEFFNESCNNILLLDTGIIPDISSSLKEFASTINMPYKSLPVGLDYLTLTVSNAISKFNDSLYLRGKRQVTDYSMMMDLLNDLAESLNENDVISKIISLFSILFAPKKLFFLTD